MSPATFELRTATVRFGDVTVLRDVDLSVQSGEAVALVGPSGAGKTTLLRLLDGTLLPSGGAALVRGRDVATLPARERRALRARTGFVHQDLSLVPVLRAGQNVVAGRLGRYGFLSGSRRVLLPRRSELVEVHRLLERVGVSEKLFERTDRLSGGQQQRVAIARALYQEPEAVLADEPVASLDPARGRDLVRLLTELAAEEGLTLVASLHDIEIARAFFPRMVGLRAGRVEFDLPTDEVSLQRLDELYRLEGTVADRVDGAVPSRTSEG